MNGPDPAKWEINVDNGPRHGESKKLEKEVAASEEWEIISQYKGQRQRKKE
jgi:hypothetical protein